MRFKAHETLIMMQFALARLRRTPNVHRREELLVASDAMSEFLDSLKGVGIKGPDAKIEELFDLMKRHLVAAEGAGIHYVPKHHFCIHLAARTD